jgi:hypothetical protein
MEQGRVPVGGPACNSVSFEFLLIFQAESKLQWFKLYLPEIKKIKIKYAHVPY